MDEDRVVNGVELSPLVLEELKRLGRPLFTYTQGQLQAAMLAAAIDGRVVDDDAPDNPGDLDDMLELSDDEARRVHGPPEVTVTSAVTAAVGGVAALPGLVGGFVARLLEERAVHLAALPQLFAAPG